MKIPSNRVSSVIKYFREQLSGQYEKEEIENFIFYSFEAFMGFNRADLVARANDTMSESMLLKFNFAVKDLMRNKPIQYILGYTVFYGLKIKVDERVLIPRQETEELVHLIIKDQGARIRRQEAGSGESRFRILDIGTGSGCISIALKKSLSAAEVHALDVSGYALELAKENAVLNGTGISFINADILDPKAGAMLGRYNLIVSNPPYVLHSEKEAMQPNVVGHEPHLALFVNDEDPLLFYRAIMRIGRTNLEPGGELYFEINERKGDELLELSNEMGYSKAELVKDINGKNRILYVKS
jgi:release factor glutamine methyltransferase